MPSKFVHLHLHTEFSMLDGLSSVEEYVERAKELEMPALALTDHGNLCGAPEFYKTCKKEGIEPIIGQEFYFVPSVEEARTKKDTEDEGVSQQLKNDKMRYHVVFLAKGYEGYRLLTELSTLAHANFYYKPLLDRGMIESLGDAMRHFVVLSGCAASPLSQAILSGKRRRAKEELLWWREVAPNFYIEMQHHGTDWDRGLNLRLYEMAQRYGLPWVITNDPHYAHKHDAGHHDALLAIQTASNIEDPNRFRFDGKGFHLRSEDEIRKAFRRYEEGIHQEGIKATTKIAKACKTSIPQWDSRNWHIPSIPGVEDGYKEFKRLAWEGLRRLGLDGKPEYVSRLKEELKVIKQMGVADVLLITRDIIAWASDRNIPVGPGRGSVCGTLAGYLAGVHKIDPVRYDLLFERFLNPARPRMPDIDTDFGQARRDEIFQYIEEKYGRDNVIHVAAFQTMKVKAAFRQLAKAYGVSWGDINRISAQFPDVIHGSWRDEDDENMLEIERLATEEPLLAEKPALMNQLRRLAGVKRTVSQHPAGVIIADPSLDIRTLVPEMWLPSPKRWVAQFDLEAVEHMGLIKQDILGLRTLDTIEECLRMVETRTGERPDIEAWVPDEEERDDEIYTSLASGDTAGVFQMEGNTNTRGIQEIGCENFEDIVSCTALYRTGPILAGFPEQFVRNRQAGADGIAYADKKLKPILRGTQGVILYQEQVMEIAKVLAGFNMEQVDDIKEAIKHKKSAFMKSLKPKFVKGCVANNVKKEAAKTVWGQIEGYSGYSYNRSHAVAYSIITYWTARLKLLYPLEFLCALLRTVDDKDKRTRYLREVIQRGYKVLPPDVNVSDENATVDYDKNAIRFGLADLAGVGVPTARKVVQGRPYSSVEDLQAALNNKGYYAKLVAGNALRSLGVKAPIHETEALLNWNFVDRLAKYREKYKGKLKKPGVSDGKVAVVAEVLEVKAARTKNNDEYRTWHIRCGPGEVYIVRLWDGTQPLWHINVGSIVHIKGEWSARWENLSVSNAGQVRLLKRSPNSKQQSTNDTETEPSKGRTTSRSA